MLLLVGLTGSARAQADAEPIAACLERTLTVGTYAEQQLAIDRDVRLQATLLVPARRGPHPGVVLIPGGGRSDRVSYPPRYVAARLARCGVAALVYDKRGTGASGGAWATATYDDLIDDAAAAFRLLRAQNDIDPARVGIVGFSQGGRLAPVVAARTGGAAFVVSIAAPFVSLAETRRYALAQKIMHLRLSTARRTELLALWDTFFERRVQARNTADLDRRIQAFARTPSRLRPPLSTERRDEPLLNSLATDYTADLSALTAPMLAIYGAADEVVPVEASVTRLRDALAEPTRQTLHLTIVPDVDHSFRYPGLWKRRYRFEDDVVLWILTQTGLLEDCLTAEPVRAIARSAAPTPEAPSTRASAPAGEAFDECMPR